MPLLFSGTAITTEDTSGDMSVLEILGFVGVAIQFFWFGNRQRWVEQSASTPPGNLRELTPMTSDQSDMIRSLQMPAAYAHPVGAIEVLQTHISWVFLTGEFAYKIKKAVNLGFVDFSMLERRHFFCQEELHSIDAWPPSFISMCYPSPAGPRHRESVETASR